MNVHLEHRWESLSWDVYLYDRDPGGSVRIHSLDGTVQHVAEGTLGIPSFTLREDALKALIDAAAEKLPADGAMASHLRDAITVRDRLLTMIETRGIR